MLVTTKTGKCRILEIVMANNSPGIDNILTSGFLVRDKNSDENITKYIVDNIGSIIICHSAILKRNLESAAVLITSSKTRGP